MPIFRRLPKKGFSNVRFATIYGIANLDDLDARFEDGATVDEASLRASGLINGRYDGVKILGSGEISKKLNVVADKISKSAREKIEKAGGSVTVIEKPIREKGVKAPGNESAAKPAATKAPAAPAAAAEPAAEAAAPEAETEGEASDADA
jgi:large subunit ribosomal protein L15